MAKQINIKIDLLKAGQLKMAQAINYSSSVLRTSLRSTLRKTSVFYVQSASKLTPQSKLRRKYKKISQTKERILYSKGARYRVQKYSGKLNRWYWVYAKSDAEKTEKSLIKNRGLYKKIWYTMLPKLGRSNNKSYSDQKTGSFAKRSTRVADKSFLKTNPYVSLSVLRPEMNKFAPGIVQHALNKAKKRLIGEMKNKMTKQIERAWNRK
jgi:hypothetical protein